jgi:stage II sporulation protein D
MHKTICFLLLILNIEFLSSQNIKISVFNSVQISSVTLDIESGEYTIKSEGSVLGEYKKGSIFYISISDNILEIRDGQNVIGKFAQIEYSCKKGNGVINIKPVNPLMEGVSFDDDFVVKVINGRIRIFNKIAMEKYIAAVIEAEGGNHAPIEYYKAQAVLIRTYTIKNMFKHAEEEFNLCDEVHCQAYKGRSTRNELILEATRSTTGVVLIDKDSILMMSPFHSNCGGETSAAGLVWQKDLPYLQPVKDPFCIESAHANWSTRISKTQWVNFINSYADKKTVNTDGNYTFSIVRRTKSVRINGLDLSLRSIREYFNLKSNYFSLQDNGTEIVFIGRGYGHGAGMCQEGAMEMARVGYTWPDIIHFYFQDVIFADYRDMDLHRY